MTGPGPRGRDKEFTLPQQVLRSLADKLYDKRKAAAMELEQAVKGLVEEGDDEAIGAVVNQLVEDFALAPQANQRKGGLIGLAACAVGLAQSPNSYLDRIIPPVIKAFTDNDPRVRYYACESLYNIAKVCPPGPARRRRRAPPSTPADPLPPPARPQISRAEFSLFFTDVFDVLCKLSADVDPNVQNAANLLDRLVKDIITESTVFSIEDFVPLLQTRLQVSNPYVRQFLIGWITALDSVPDINVLEYLPDFVDGLFNMLSDTSKEIRQQADCVLNEFLSEIKVHQDIDFASVTETLIEKAKSQDEFSRLTAINWLHEFVLLAPKALIPRLPPIVDAILPCVGHSEVAMADIAARTNQELLSLVGEGALTSTEDKLEVLNVAQDQLTSFAKGTTRLESLNWIAVLLEQDREEVLEHLADLVPALLDATADGTEDVVNKALEVQAQIAKESVQFKRLVSSLLDRFRGENGQQFLRQRGGLVIRRMCAELGAKVTFCTLSNSLSIEADVAFASTLVQALNLILLTAPELSSLRKELKEARYTEAGAALFVTLYKSWSQSAAATISLCLVAEMYQHAFDVLSLLGELEVTSDLLVEIDTLVSMLESPIFASLRLNILNPAENPALIKALYAILMFLPQSKAFDTLSRRLKNAPTLELLKMNELIAGPGLAKQASFSRSGSFKESAKKVERVEIDFAGLLGTFEAKQTNFVRHVLSRGKRSASQ